MCQSGLTIEEVEPEVEKLAWAIVLYREDGWCLIIDDLMPRAIHKSSKTPVYKIVLAKNFPHNSAYEPN